MTLSCIENTSDYYSENYSEMECSVPSPSRTPGHCSGSYFVTERDPSCTVSPVFAGQHDFSLNIIVARAESELAWPGLACTVRTLNILLEPEIYIKLMVPLLLYICSLFLPPGYHLESHSF